MPAKTTTAPKRRRATTGRTTRAARRRRVTPEDLLKLTFLADPRISPDGRRVAFVHKVVGEKNEYATSLWTVAADGAAAPQRFTAGPRDAMPRWSPDGTRLAFVRSVEKGHPQVHLIDVDGGEATALTDLPEGSIGAVAWSPDGRRLAISFREQDPDWTSEAKKQREAQGASDPPRVIDHWWYRLDGDGYFNGQRYHLYLVDAATGAASRVYTKDTLGFFGFDFSPDGKRIVIATNRDPRAGLREWNDDLLVLTVATGRLATVPKLPRGPKSRPRWSPDGKRIAYAGREGPDSTYSTENLELWTCDPRKGDARCLTGDTDACLMAPPVTDTAEIAFEPNYCWAPDGKRLYIQLGWHGECHIASVPARGGALVTHTSGAKVCQLGTVSDDGRRAAVLVGTPARPDEVHVAELRAASAKLSAQGALGSHRRRHQGAHVGDATDRVSRGAPLPGRPGDPRRSPRAVRPRLLPRVPGARRQGLRRGLLESPRQQGLRTGSLRGHPGALGIGGLDGHPGRDGVHAVPAGGRPEAHGHHGRQLRRLHDELGDRPHPRLRGRHHGPVRVQPRQHVRQQRLRRGARPLLGRQRLGPPGGEVGPEPAEAPRQRPHADPDHPHVRKVPCRLVRYPRSTSHGMSRGGPPDMRLHRLHQILAWWERYLAP
jgi:Tol biopolymer transport system component